MSADEASGGWAPPCGAERYTDSSLYTWSFQSAYVPMPATFCARPPSISGAAAGVGATPEDANGNPHTGVEFHTSCTVGLLFTVTPQRTGFDANFPRFA
ncbi:MAG: hypothetical protein DMD66_03715 [Gemmatimonadetes bacterium]|nr:MAG: hypothetical protein DMD66_03715 [Gemmatimonadota bacterium]